jgi:UDP-N-acetylmuramoyl-L-alanyl-D-glutamate--2,6-diaminopimelate ligase
MGAAAASADIAIITSDNPRSEDPNAIIAQVLEGTVHREATIITEPDRELAIARAFELAGEGDVVLILGKGHEQGQEFADHTVPFDDREVARRHLQMRWVS